MNGELPQATARAILGELVTEREGFLAALADVEPSLLTTPGLAGEWSARELLAHLGYWCGHAAEALHRAAQGTLHEFGSDDPDFDVDAVNETVARVARETDLASVRLREEAAYAALVERLETAEDGWLLDTTGYRETLEQVLREDGPEHYHEHTLDIRSWFTGDADEDEDEDDDPEADAEADPGERAAPA
ncbi:MAG: maleylpyruvate isomerase N-terminal domain-containing protein [Chloroflexota bacterium]